MEMELMIIIRGVGIPAHIKGYQYLSDGITMVIEDRNLLGAVTKELYPAIAQKNNTSPEGVEKAIRQAIKIAWLSSDTKFIEELFFNPRYGYKKKPTNREFIAVIADKLRMERKAC